MLQAFAPVMNQDKNAREYDSRLSEIVSVAKHEVSTLEELCHKALGAAPVDVFAHLRLEDVERLRAAPGERINQNDFGFPEPHPVDYDWRFDAQTAAKLASFANPSSKVLCIGTPTIFPFLAQRAASVTLVDRNPFLERGLPKASTAKFLVANIEDVKLEPNTFDIAIMDPPWYLDAYDAWLNKVVPALKPTASIYLIAFRELTRPTAVVEREYLQRRLRQLGTVSQLPWLAAYWTPPFELETLRHCKIPSMARWRQGEVLRVDVGGKSVAHAPLVTFPEHKSSWRRFLIGGQVVAVALDPSDRGPIRYHRPEGLASYMLNSVSRRDPKRTAISIWTSRNRAAVLAGTERVASLLQNIGEVPESQFSAEVLTTSDDQSALVNLLSDLDIGTGSSQDA